MRDWAGFVAGVQYNSNIVRCYAAYRERSLIPGAHLKQSIIPNTLLTVLMAFCISSCHHSTDPGPNPIQTTRVIVFTVGNKLCTMNTDGSDFQVVASSTPGSFLNWHACMSPDESKVVYQFADTTYQQIFLFDRVTRRTINITGDNIFHEMPVFSPDGRTIVFVSAQGWLQNMCSYELITARITQLTHGLNCYDPSFSLDGSRIVFYLGNGLDSNGVAIIDKNGTNFHFLGPGVNPALFPNGNKILFQSGVSAYDNGLFSMNTDGTNRTFFMLVPWQSSASISPDGSTITSEYFTGNRELVSINGDGTGFVNVTRDTSAEYCPMYLRDGRTIMYVMYDTTRTFFLDLMSSDGNNRRHIFQSNETIYLGVY